MPSSFNPEDELVQTPEQEGVSSFEKPNPIAPRQQGMGDFVSGLGEGLNPFPAIKQLVTTNPIDTAKTLVKNQTAQFAKIPADWKDGRYDDAIMHGASGMIPLIGPAMSDTADELTKPDGDLRKAGRSFGNVLMMKVVPDTAGTLIRNAPEIASGVKSAVPVVAGAVKGGAKAAIAPIEYGAHKLPIPASIAGAAAGHYGGSVFGPTGSIIGGVAGAATPIVRGAIQGARDVMRADWPPPATDPFSANPSVASRMRFGGPADSSGGRSFPGVGMSGAPPAPVVEASPFAPVRPNPAIAGKMRFGGATENTGGAAASPIPTRQTGTPSSELPAIRNAPFGTDKPAAFQGPNRVNPNIARNLRFTPTDDVNAGSAASPATLGTRAEMLRQQRLRADAVRNQNRTP